MGYSRLESLFFMIWVLFHDMSTIFPNELENMIGRVGNS